MSMKVEDIDFNDLKQFLAPRARDSHKGNFGHSLLIGGNHGGIGAIMLSSIAAARTGSGLTTTATRPGNAVYMVTRFPEIMAHDIANAVELMALIRKATVIGIGPGLGQDGWAQSLVHVVLQQPMPLVVDADALNLLANSKSRFYHDHWILTPHPGEAARLLQVEIKDILADRQQAVIQLQQTYGGVVILKGQHTLVKSENRLHRCTGGNPGMASGGMGDVLTGLITGLLAQKIPLAAAAKLGVDIHAKAGDLAAKAGERGTLATDLLPYIRQLVNLD